MRLSPRALPASAARRPRQADNRSLRGLSRAADYVRILHPTPRCPARGKGHYRPCWQAGTGGRNRNYEKSSPRGGTAARKEGAGFGGKARPPSQRRNCARYHEPQPRLAGMLFGGRRGLPIRLGRRPRRARPRSDTPRSRPTSSSPSTNAPIHRCRARLSSGLAPASRRYHAGMYNVPKPGYDLATMRAVALA